MKTYELIVQTIFCMLAFYILTQAVMLRNIPKVRFFILLSLSVSLYALGYLFQLDSRSVEAALIALRVQYCGIAIYSVCFYLFIRDYGNRPVKRRRHVGLLFLVPLLIIFLANAYPRTRLFFAELSAIQQAPFRLYVKPGPFYYLYDLYSLVFLYLSLREIWHHYLELTLDERRTRRLFTGAAIIPGAAIMIHILNPTLSFRLTSQFLVISLAVLGVYTLWFRPQDWLIYSRERVVEHMANAYVLFDSYHRFADANHLAVQFFPTLENVRPGTPARNIADFPIEILDNEKDLNEFNLSTANGSLVLRASLSPVVWDGVPVGYCIILYDITELKLMVDTLQERAATDGLTGLINRDTFMILAQRDFNLHIRSRMPASFIMLDIDHFKRVNDTFGHQNGDLVLAAVADIFKKRLRRTDISGRYGGEEFCAFLPNTTGQSAEVICEDIRRAIALHQFTLNGTPYHITVSMGVCSIELWQHARLEDMIGSADRALYQAKRDGRNRVVLAQWKKHQPPGGCSRKDKDSRKIN